MATHPHISGSRDVSEPFPFRADDLTLAAMNDLVHTLHPKIDVAHFEVRETFLFGSGQVSVREHVKVTH